LKFRMKISLRSATPRILPLLALFLGANLFAVYFVSQEKYIYFWDTAGYWIRYQDLCALLVREPLKAFWTIAHSIRGDDYNCLEVLLLTPFRFFFGDGRLPYILSVVNIYFVISVVIFYFVFKKISTNYFGDQSALLPSVSALTLLLLPNFWIPVLVGWPDVAGVAVIGVILLIFLDGPVETQKLWKLFILGSLLCLLVLMRRWYAYWVVSFFIALSLERLIDNFGRYHLEIKQYLPAAVKICLLGMLSASLFFAIATPVAKQMLITRYGDIFSAYKTENPAIQVFRELGLFIILLFSSGVVCGVLDRKTRLFSLFLLFQLATVFLLFSAVQNFDRHHFYLLIPGIVVFVFFSLSKIFSRLKTTALRTFFLAAYVLLLTLNFTVVLIPGAAGHLTKLAFLFSKTEYYPLVRNDLGEIARVKRTLQNLTEDSGDSISTIYVLSSSLTLNDDVLRNACRDDRGLYGRILRTSHVDKRDGFPNGLLQAKYVVVTDPVGYSLRPTDQRVIGIPAGEMIAGKGIGTAFARLPYEFVLDGNVRVHIYEKVRPFRKDDLAQLIRAFIEYYPGREDTFTLTYSSREILRHPPKPETSCRVNYGEKVELLGITVSKLTNRQLLMSYYWKFLDELPHYKAFVHFKDADNRILFQDDHFLYDPKAGEEYRGKFVKETYVVNVPHSAYGQEVSIAIGVFAPDPRGERLTIESSGGMRMYEQNTSVIIGRLKLQGTPPLFTHEVSFSSPQYSMTDHPLL
jgi:hypothetical protein